MVVDSITVKSVAESLGESIFVVDRTSSESANPRKRRAPGVSGDDLLTYKHEANMRPREGKG